MSETELKPCPFCGADAPIVKKWSEAIEIGWGDGLGSPGTHYIEHEKVRCRACYSQASPEFWNKRTDITSTELERDLARWENARDVWMATDKAKDERIAELERQLKERDEAPGDYSMADYSIRV